LYWQYIFKKWEVSVGVKKIYWGVIESNHLVDIVNQADALEGFDPEQKLGQPMVHFSFAPKWGTLDFMIMPYFRQLRFPGPLGRLTPPFIINYSNISFESELEEFNPDMALRFSKTIGMMDIGISHFYGTSRLPLFSFDTLYGSFSPYYELIHRSGLDLQYVTGSMLWKLEGIYRYNSRKTITAFAVGGEYTFSNIFQSGADLGIVAEYLYDDRGDELFNGMNDDFFIALRLGFNDKQSTDFLGGTIIDRKNKTLIYTASFNRRLGDSWKISFNMSGFENIKTDDFLYLLRNDSFIELSLAKYF